MSPPIFVMNGIEIYIDESGDFGPFDERCPFYIVTMVFHEMIDTLYSQIQELEYCLSLLGFEDHCIHSSPAIRGEDEYYGMDVVLRRKVMSNFAGFVRRTNLRYKCFFIKKQPGSTEEAIVQSLRDVFDPFFLRYFDRLAAYSLITVAYDKGQKLLSRLITETFQRRFNTVRLTKVLPIHSRIFQVADYICSIKRMSYRLESTGTLAKSEMVFFGTEANFRKNWFKPLLKQEWK